MEGTQSEQKVNLSSWGLDDSTNTSNPNLSARIAQAGVTALLDVDNDISDSDTDGEEESVEPISDLTAHLLASNKKVQSSPAILEGKAPATRKAVSIDGSEGGHSSTDLDLFEQPLKTAFRESPLNLINGEIINASRESPEFSPEVPVIHEKRKLESQDRGRSSPAFFDLEIVKPNLTFSSERDKLRLAQERNKKRRKPKKLHYSEVKGSATDLFDAGSSSTKAAGGGSSSSSSLDPPAPTARAPAKKTPMMGMPMMGMPMMGGANLLAEMKARKKGAVSQPAAKTAAAKKVPASTPKPKKVPPPKKARRPSADFARSKSDISDKRGILKNNSQSTESLHSVESIGHGDIDASIVRSGTVSKSFLEKPSMKQLKNKRQLQKGLSSPALSVHSLKAARSSGPKESGDKPSSTTNAFNPFADVLKNANKSRKSSADSNDSNGTFSRHASSETFSRNSSNEMSSRNNSTDILSRNVSSEVLSRNPSADLLPTKSSESITMSRNQSTEKVLEDGTKTKITTSTVTSISKETSVADGLSSTTTTMKASLTETVENASVEDSEPAPQIGKSVKDPKLVKEDMKEILNESNKDEDEIDPRLKTGGSMVGAATIKLPFAGMSARKDSDESEHSTTSTVDSSNSSIPAWKQALLTKKKENPFEKQKSMDEPAATSSGSSTIPQWKQEIMKRKLQRQKSQGEGEILTEKNEEKEKDDLADLPPWRRELILKKRQRAAAAGKS